MTTKNDNLHKFEGTHAVSAVRSYIEGQLAKPFELRENEKNKNYYFSEVRVKSRTDDDSRLNIKLFVGSLGGASVEIWKAEDSEEVAREVGVSNIGRQRPSMWHRYLKMRKDIPQTHEAYPTPADRAKSVFEVIRKKEQGIPLTDKDLASPYFTEQ